eukprot:901191-Prorocentrum_lima.AAC.1
MGGELFGLALFCVVWPHFELTACEVPTDRHVCGPFIGVPMGAPGVVCVECEGGVRERQVWLVLQQPPIQEANNVGGFV